MGQAISNFATSRCGDTGQDEFQGSTWPLDTHIFSQRPGQQLIPTPLTWSRGSDSFTHPVTNYVTNRIVRNPPLRSDPDGDSTSWTREVSQLGLGHLVTRDESDTVRQFGRDPALSWSRGSDSFTHSGTNSVRNRIVRNPPLRSDPDGDSSSQTREVSQLAHGHLITRDVSNSASQLRRDPAITLPKWSDIVSLRDSSITESDSVSQLGLDPVFSSPKWLEEFLGDSSITVGADTVEESEVLKEVRERETFPIPSPIPELLQIPLSSSHGSDLIVDLVTHSVPIPPPGSDPVPDSTSPSSVSDSVSQLCRDPAIALQKWLDIFLRDSSNTVLEEEKEVVREVLREERERDEERGGGGAKLGRVERWMKHYSSFQKILLVGEGDFSFSACLAVAFGCAHNIIATSLDSRGFLSSNYRNAMSNIESLTSRGAKVMHGVDATQMAKQFVFDGMTFDRIVYNFPHAGFFRHESRETQLRRQQKLVRLFMKNAKKMIDRRGEIHVSHKSNGFFLEWNLEQLATNEGLRLIESLHFRLIDYPGYHTKYGFGGDKNFDCNPSKTYKFGLKN